MSVNVFGKIKNLLGKFDVLSVSAISGLNTPFSGFCETYVCVKCARKFRDERNKTKRKTLKLHNLYHFYHTQRHKLVISDTFAVFPKSTKSNTKIVP